MIVLFVSIYVFIAIIVGMCTYIYDKVTYSYGSYLYNTSDLSMYIFLSVFWPLTLIVLIFLGICKFLKFIADTIAESIIIKKEAHKQIRRMNDETK